MVRFYSYFGREMHTGVLSDEEFERAKSLPMDVGGDWEPTYELELPPVKRHQNSLILRVDSSEIQVGAYTHNGWMPEFYEGEFIDKPEACVSHLLVHPWDGEVPLPSEEARPEDFDVFEAAVEEELEEFEETLSSVKADIDEEEEEDEELQEQVEEAEEAIGEFLGDDAED